MKRGRARLPGVAGWKDTADVAVTGTHPAIPGVPPSGTELACWAGMLPLLLLACSPVRLLDDTQFNLDVADTSLGTPYLIGAKITFIVELRGGADGWSIASGDDAVISLGDPFVERNDGDVELKVDAIAAGVGTTTVTVTDDHGEVVLSPTVEVRAPTRVEVRAGTDVNRDGTASPLTQPQVCVGGEAAFRLDFFDGDQALSGAGGLQVAAADVETDQSSFGDDHDWIVVAPSSAGTLTVDLETGGVSAGSIEFLAVDPGEIASVALDPDSELGVEAGDSLRVVADAEDGEGERVFGAPFSWTQDGTALSESGDAYSYTYDPDVETEVEVTVGGASDTVTVHGTGDVVDTGSVACAVANVGPVGIAVLLAALGASRRVSGRSRRTAP